MAIRILIASSQPLIRQGMRSLLEKEADFIIVGEASHGKDVLFDVLKKKADVLLMDIPLNGINGREIVDYLRASKSEVKIIIFTLLYNEALVYSMVCQGVEGYLLQTLEASKILHAVRDVHKGQTVLYMTWGKYCFLGAYDTGYLRTLMQTEWRKMGKKSLSVKEIEILGYLLGGMKNEDIGKLMHISEMTVKNHINGILKKVHAKNRNQAILYGLKHKLISLESHFML